jgi:hypothetical protein
MCDDKERKIQQAMVSASEFVNIFSFVEMLKVKEAVPEADMSTVRIDEEQRPKRVVLVNDSEGEVHQVELD